MKFQRKRKRTGIEGSTRVRTRQSTHGIANLSRIPSNMPPVAITLEELSEHFHMPQKDVANKLGMCLTSLKKICRAHGISRWPHRKLKSLERCMQKVSDDSHLISSQLGVDGTAAAVQGQSQESAESSCVSSARASRASSPSARPEGVWEGALARHDSVAHNCDDSGAWPSFVVSASDVQTLIITHWSMLWTAFHLRHHILAPLGGTSIRFSEDGCSVSLRFLSGLAALQARNMCEQACAVLRAREVEAPPSPIETHAARSPSPCAGHSDLRESSTSSTGGLGDESCDLRARTQPPWSKPRFLETSSDRIFAAPVAGENGSMPFAKQTDLREVSISSSWMLPLAPATNRPAINPYETAAGNTSSHGAAPSSGWLRTLASPPQSCGSLSNGSGTASGHSSDEWMSPCLVSC